MSCGYLLESPHRGNFSECLQDMFNRNNPSKRNREACVWGIDMDQMLQNAASDHGLLFAFSLANLKTHGKVLKQTFKFKDKYSKKLWCTDF